MSTFAYEAMNQAGQDVKDEVEAASSEDALAKIRNLGYFPTRIREKGGGRAKRAAGTKKKSGAGFVIGGVGTKAITQFTRQLSTLQDAGLPILRSLNILEDQQRPGALKNILRGVSEDIVVAVSKGHSSGRRWGGERLANHLRGILPCGQP